MTVGKIFLYLSLDLTGTERTVVSHIAWNIVEREAMLLTTGWEKVYLWAKTVHVRLS
jgi:hypothetical protein